MFLNHAAVQVAAQFAQQRPVFLVRIRMQVERRFLPLLPLRARQLAQRFVTRSQRQLPGFGHDFQHQAI